MMFSLTPWASMNLFISASSTTVILKKKILWEICTSVEGEKKSSGATKNYKVLH